MQQIEALLRIMARLRDPIGGCPWDQAQSFTTIAPYTIEEAYEVADAIERGDFDELREELGDLLLQVVFHARMAEEIEQFDFSAVVEALNHKLVARHPHVFADHSERDEQALNRAWEAQKERERRAKSNTELGVLDGVAMALPALMRAEKLQRRAARVGFDWEGVDGVRAKVQEELEEIDAELGAATPDHHALLEEVGDLLFATVNLARHLKIEPEVALRQANLKFERRFRAMEALLAEQNRAPKGVSLEDWEQLWQKIKIKEKD